MSDHAGATAPPGAPSTTSYLTHRQIQVVFSGLMLGMLLAALDQTILGTALPTIVGDLGGLNHLSWVVTAYLLTSTASTPLYGKLSDLYGRRITYQAAIVIFLVGSALAGASQTIGQLIAFRGMQGLGAGGLMSLAFAIIGDVVAPRERGRYQGYTGGTFAVASIAGPLLGGFFTQHLSWRWIFYINIPIGLVALVVTSTALNYPFQRRPHRIDYLGAAAMVGGVSALLLVTVWGGSQYPWGSATIIELLVTGVLLTGFFLWWQTRASEPILPLHLFRNRIFSVSGTMMFLLGLAMFGAIIYIPVYLQIAHHATPTSSGLLMLPMMFGMLGASVTSGRIISKIGRYKAFPVFGTALLSISTLLLSRLGAHTSLVVTSFDILLLGLGVGSTMQVLILAMQNSVNPNDMGVATAAGTFFRSMGGAFGTAMFGAVLTARLGFWLPQLVPPDPSGHAATASIIRSPASLLKLPPVVQHGVVEAFVRSMHTVFLVALPLAVGTFVLSLFLEEIELRSSAPGGAGTAGDAQPAGHETVEPVTPLA